MTGAAESSADSKAADLPSTRDNVIAVIFGLAFLAGGLLFVFGSWGAYFRDTQIIETGEKVTAKITDLSSVKPADGDADYYINYTFVASDGTTYKSQRAMQRYAWEKLSIGGNVDIVYQKDNPKKSLPAEGAGVTSMALVWIASIFGALMGAGGLALLGAVFLRYHART